MDHHLVCCYCWPRLVPAAPGPAWPALNRKVQVCGPQTVPLWAPLLSETCPPGPVVGSAEVLANHCSPHKDGHGLVPAVALWLAASAPRLDPKEGSQSLRQWQ